MLERNSSAYGIPGILPELTTPFMFPDGLLKSIRELLAKLCGNLGLRLE